MDFVAIQHLITKHTTMTNSEILKANLLDIVFENRNKEYGAYDLRKGYNSRLLIALSVGLSIILLFVFISSTNKSKAASVTVNTKRQELVL